MGDQGAFDTPARRVLERSEVERIELARFLYADHGGVIRGKATSRSRLADRLRTGIPQTVGMMAMSMLDDLQPVEGMGPVGEVRIVPDPLTFVTLPYAPGAAAMLADLRKLDGSPWEACSRSFLKDAIAQLATEGYRLAAAFEPEFTLGRRLPAESGPDRLAPLDDSLCYSTTGFDLAHDYAVRLARALEAQGLRIEHYYPELGHGQQEVSIRYAPALRAADNHVLFRETVRGVAFRMSMWASLAPKPIAGQAGNGAHLHLSLWDDSDTNLFEDGADGNGLSELGYAFIGGLRAHMPALTALTCGSVNSFRRLTPQMWAGAFNCYGPDNREAAIRICSPLSAGSTNLEFKPSDSSANPYLSLGAVIHAGLDGIRRKLEPGAAVHADPSTLGDAERDALGVSRLPLDLSAALDALEGDELLMEALGPLRRTAYLAVKRSESKAFAARDAAYETFRHFTTF